ncbi:hypothetical protein C8R44DRAFT_976401 [Mycena epipterygia]|nr:hypothetical protein C8R44DRAFT_976401 [Mycena epipterygia]
MLASPFIYISPLFFLVCTRAVVLPQGPSDISKRTAIENIVPRSPECVGCVGTSRKGPTLPCTHSNLFQRTGYLGCRILNCP